MASRGIRFHLRVALRVKNDAMDGGAFLASRPFYVNNTAGSALRPCSMRCQRHVSGSYLEQTNEPILKVLPMKQELIARGKLLSRKWMDHPAKALGRLEKALVEDSFREFRHFR